MRYDLSYERFAIRYSLILGKNVVELDDLGAGRRKAKFYMIKKSGWFELKPAWKLLACQRLAIIEPRQKRHRLSPNADSGDNPPTPRPTRPPA